MSPGAWEPGSLGAYRPVELRAVERAAPHHAGTLRVGIDHSPWMVDVASRRNAKAVAEGRVLLLEGDASRLPSGPFDRVLAVNVAQF